MKRYPLLLVVLVGLCLMGLFIACGGGGGGGTTYYADADGDGYGDPDVSQVLDETMAGWVLDSTDCDDTPGTGAAINPAATDVCDSVDNDCSGTADDDYIDGTVTYTEPDGTGGFILDDSCGTGNCVGGTVICSGSQTTLECSTAGNASTDLCDGQDNDCNSATPDGSGEADYAMPCDGIDTDLCLESTYSCNGFALVCDDNTDDEVEICFNDVDDDCNVATDDDTVSQCLGLVYVNIADPLATDSGTGTMGTPFETIQPAIDHAAGLYSTAEVKVAAGTYTVDSTPPIPLDNIQMAEGVSLYGGYDTDDWSTRDPGTNETTIQDTSVYTSSVNAVVMFLSGITENTVIDGFTITGGAGSQASGFYIFDGSSPTISNNQIYGGSGTSITTGVWFTDASPTITNNYIEGGSGGLLARGIYAWGNSCSSTLIEGNRIQAADDEDAPFMYCSAIVDDCGGLTIRNNLMASVAATAPPPDANCNVTAFYDPTVSYLHNNTILAIGGRSSGVVISGGAPEIINNIFQCTENIYAVIEVDSDSDPAVFRNNDIDCASIYVDEGVPGIASVAGTAVSTGEGTDTLENWGNIEVNPVFMDADGADDNIYTLSDNALWLSSGSPTSVTQGGMDLSAGFTDDFDGVSRSAPWSMGAYEY
jgi:hypothetical protein